MRHLFVDISSHGFGHLAQVAPILNALHQRQPDLKRTIRCGLDENRLRARIHGTFEFIPASSDFGFAMHDAVRINLPATAQQYRTFHANWAQRVANETRFLTDQHPDLVLTDVAYLPLAGATQAGIPSWSMCSLNWSDLFAHFFNHEPWSPLIHAEILAAYCSAERFLRLTPAMPMPALPNQQTVEPVALQGIDRRSELRRKLACCAEEKTVLIAFGGIDRNLHADAWPPIPGIRWLVPQGWAIRRNDMAAFEPLGFDFSDLLASVDAVLTKPGYGTFVEAACDGTPVLYQRREDWPEQEPLIDWLKNNARCQEVSMETLSSGLLQTPLDTLWQQSAPPRPEPGGVKTIVQLLHDRLIA